VDDVDPINVDAFEALVADALATIPDQLRVQMENVAIIIDDESPPGALYGVYEGIPLTSRGCGCRKCHPRASSSQFVLVEKTTELVGSS
jgi:predicted Zn-dependent protease with MMP-like domain